MSALCGVCSEGKVRRGGLALNACRRMLPRLTCCGLPVRSFLGYEDLDVVNPQSSSAEKVDSVDADDVRRPRSPLCGCQDDAAYRMVLRAQE